MANVHNLKEIRNYLRDQVPADEFNMSTFGFLDTTSHMDISCKTPACIAGHVCHYYGIAAGRFSYNIGEAAAKVLELTESEQKTLFHVKGLPHPLVVPITPQQAASVIDHYLDTGKFDWKYVLTGEQINTAEITEPTTELIPA